MAGREYSFWVGLMQDVNPLRLAIKAILIFVIANVVFAYFNPPFGKLSLYNWLFPGRMRFPYVRREDDLLRVHSISVFENFDAMFSSTAIADNTKLQINEYRVFFLGDSSMWGFDLAMQNTLVGQINRLNLQTCDGRYLRAYNLGYPLPAGVRDVLLLDKAREYHPNLFVWFVTMDTFMDKNANADFLTTHPDETINLVRTYGLKIDIGKIEPSSFWDKTIAGQRLALKKMIFLQADGLGWSATGVDYYVWTKVSAPQGASTPGAGAGVMSDKNKNKLLNSFVFPLLQTAQSEAGSTPLLVVNEPVQILSNNNVNNPDQAYALWAYKTYRDGLAEWVRGGNYNYMDLGDSLSADNFVSELHSTARGEQKLANQIVPELLRQACP